MSTSKHIDKICIAIISIILVATILFICCNTFGITATQQDGNTGTSEMFSEDDLNGDWDTTDATEITLKDNSADISGNGAYFANNTLYIITSGKYVIRGTLSGSTIINAKSNDTIWLMLDGVEMTSSEDAPLHIEQADKVFLTLKDNTQNTLTFENTDKDATIDGCIYSRDDLSINGKGNLTINSSALHGIVCNDNLVFAGGTNTITATKDAVHSHDSIKICNSDLTLSAGGNGLRVGNDNESALFYCESGNISITECDEGIEANDITITGGTLNIQALDDGINANGEDGTSFIAVSGGDITIIMKEGRDIDGFDSNGDITISGGNVFISIPGNGSNNAIDYGKENGGNFNISGGTIIACGSNNLLEAPDSNSPQGFIMPTVSVTENNTTLSLLDKDGVEIIKQREIPCTFTSALLSCPEMSVGDIVKMKIEETETEIQVTNTMEGTGGMSGGSGNGAFNQPNKDKNGNNNSSNNSTENNNGSNPPEPPNASGENAGKNGTGNNGGGAGQQNPNGNNAPPDQPNASQDGTMPNGQNGTPPEAPPEAPTKTPNSNRNGGGETQNPNDNNQETEGKNPGNNQNPNQKPGGQDGQAPGQQNADNQAQTTENTNSNQSEIPVIGWIVLGVSVLVLIGGLIIVIRKKN